MFDTKIIPRQTVGEMVRAYDTAIEKMREGYMLLADAERLLQNSFGRWVSTRNYTSEFNTISRYDHHWNYEKPELTIEERQKKIKQGAWHRILEAIEFEKIASSQRIADVQKSIEEDKMPEISEEEIYNILMAFTQNATQIRDELILEAFEILRPHRTTWNDYKTNSEFGVGKKVILARYLDTGWGDHYSVYGMMRERLEVIDKAFHILDGKGIPDGYRSPLVDGIQTHSHGETEYFKYKCHQNGNLHLEFKRMDLVAQLNMIAGATQLKGER